LMPKLAKLESTSALKKIAAKYSTIKVSNLIEFKQCRLIQEALDDSRREDVHLQSTHLWKKVLRQFKTQETSTCTHSKNSQNHHIGRETIQM
jgi:hypothetical protein